MSGWALRNWVRTKIDSRSMLDFQYRSNTVLRFRRSLMQLTLGVKWASAHKMGERAAFLAPHYARPRGVVQSPFCDANHGLSMWREAVTGAPSLHHAHD